MTLIGIVQFKYAVYCNRILKCNSNRRHTCVIFVAHQEITFAKTLLHSRIGTNRRIESAITRISVFPSPGHVENSLGTGIIYMDQTVEFTRERKNFHRYLLRIKRRALTLFLQDHIIPGLRIDLSKGNGIGAVLFKCVTAGSGGIKNYCIAIGKGESVDQIREIIYSGIAVTEKENFLCAKT